MRLLLVYHFFEPDDVISARLFSELGAELAARGWEVTALTCDRLSSDPRAKLPREETWRGVRIVRLPRPAWDQGRPVQRLANSAYLLAAWSAYCAREKPFDAVVVGTDPAFAALLFVWLRAHMPRARLVHWAFDLYPEAIAADRIAGSRALVPVARACMRVAYGCVDEIVDIGPHMRERLAAYGGRAARSTITPWALVEPHTPAVPDPQVRRELFGDARIGLLYSGNLGRAHAYAPYLSLARKLRARVGDAVAFTFASRGSGLEQLKSELRPDDTNVRIASFCEERALGARLAAADMHLISLRPEWSGIVVPSKFFGSLALGKPLLYAGPARSDVARWTREHGVGWVLDDAGSVDAAAALLAQLVAGSLPARERLSQCGEAAFRLYHSRFSRTVAAATWHALLSNRPHSSATRSKPARPPLTHPAEGAA